MHQTRFFVKAGSFDAFLMIWIHIPPSHTVCVKFRQIVQGVRPDLSSGASRERTNAKKRLDNSQWFQVAKIRQK